MVSSLSENKASLFQITHPLLTQNYVLATPPIEEFANTVRQWVNATIRGGMIYGDSGIGKTYAIKYVHEFRKQIFSANIPVFKSTWKQVPRNTEVKFYKRLLMDFGHGYINAKSAEDLEKRVVEYLKTCAMNAGGSRIILFIDDAHYLTPDDYGWLCHIFNLLKYDDILLFTFLVGEEKLLAMRNSFKASNDTQFIGRFMWKTHHFKYLSSVEDFIQVLEGYDTYSEFPPNSHCSYVKFFLPLAYEAGFRFTNYAMRLWTIYNNGRKAVSTRKSETMSMGSCTIYITYLMQKLKYQDASDLDLDINLIEDAVQNVINLDQ